MYNLFRTQILGTPQGDIEEEDLIEKHSRMCGGRATYSIQQYQQERLWKSQFILIEIVAAGHDIKRFLEALN
jgi:hypothetical protein